MALAAAVYGRACKTDMVAGSELETAAVGVKLGTVAAAAKRAIARQAAMLVVLATLAVPKVVVLAITAIVNAGTRSRHSLVARAVAMKSTGANGTTTRQTVTTHATAAETGPAAVMVDVQTAVALVGDAQLVVGAQAAAARHRLDRHGERQFFCQHLLRPQADVKKQLASGQRKLAGL